MLGGVGTFLGPVLGAGTVGVMASGLPWVVPPGPGRSAGVPDRAGDREDEAARLLGRRHSCRNKNKHRGGTDMNRNKIGRHAVTAGDC